MDIFSGFCSINDQFFFSDCQTIVCPLLPFVNIYVFDNVHNDENGDLILSVDLLTFNTVGKIGKWMYGPDKVKVTDKHRLLRTSPPAPLLQGEGRKAPSPFGRGLGWGNGSTSVILTLQKHHCFDNIYLTDKFVLANGPFAAVFLGNLAAIEPIADTFLSVILTLQKHYFT